MAAIPPPMPTITVNGRRRVILFLVLGGILLLFFLLGILFLLRVSSLRYYYIPSESMEPTLQRGESFFVDKAAYRSAAPRRGDIVLFTGPPEANDGVDGIEFAKRVVGLPGETVKVRGARLRIGGRSRARIPMAQGSRSICD